MCSLNVPHRFGIGLFVFITLMLTGCGSGGGGGSSTPTITPPSSVPLGTAIANRSANGLSANTNISGTISGVTVTGTATFTEAPAVAGTFNSVPCLAQTTTLTGSVTGGGLTIPIASTAVGYSNSSYATLGVSSSTEYDVAQSPFTLPATVSAGDTAVVGTFNRYADSTMAVLLGTTKASYVVQADPASSNDLIVEEIEQTYDTGNNNTENSQVFYKVTTLGSMSLSSESIQTSTSNLTFTAH